MLLVWNQCLTTQAANQPQIPKHYAIFLLSDSSRKLKVGQIHKKTICYSLVEEFVTQFEILVVTVRHS